jgi:hypothetical protein
VGMCFLSLDTGECILSQVVVRIHKTDLRYPIPRPTERQSTNSLYSILSRYYLLCASRLQEIVMPESNVNPEKSKLCRIIGENLPGASIIAGARRYFREELGMEYINQVRSPKIENLS